MEDKMPPKMHKKWIHNTVDTLKESLQRGERVGVDEVVVAEGGMEIDVERDNDMMGEKQEAVYATREHEAEDIEMNTKAERWKRMRILKLRWSHQATLVLVPIFTLNIEHLLILVCTSPDPVVSIPRTRPLILNVTTMMLTPRLFHPPLRIVVILLTLLRQSPRVLVHRQLLLLRSLGQLSSPMGWPLLLLWHR